MVREDREDVRSTCPECGSELAVETRSRNGTPVVIAVCTDFPSCNYFCWSPEGDGSDFSDLFGELADWVVDESLSILHDELSAEDWSEALDVIGEPSEGGGDGGG